MPTERPDSGEAEQRPRWPPRRRGRWRGLAAAAARGGVRDERVLRAVQQTPRSRFVPSHLAPVANADEPLPIGQGQTTSQPSLVALMVEALELEPSSRALEIGTGHGWQTAVMARLAAEVYSIERHEQLAAAARENLAGFDNVVVVVGDGTRGLPEHAPYDGVVISAATPQVPPALGEQMVEGGVVVAPIGGFGYQEVVRYRARAGQLVRDRALTAARFVPLVPDDEGGAPDRVS